MPEPLNPYVSQYAVPRVTVNVGGRLDGGRIVGGFDVDDVLDYSYTSDILTLTDTATIDIANPDGKYSRTGAEHTIPPGSRVVMSMSDPNVAGGAEIPRLTGLVVNPRKLSRGGEKIQLQCADQGWYLERCDVPLYFNLQASKNLDDLTRVLLQGHAGQDYGWGFQNADGSLNVTWSNVTYQTLLRHLNQGAAGAQRSVTAQAIKSASVKVDASYVQGVTLPPMQAGEGTKIGQIFIDYARRAKLLVNVTSDGALVFFKPNYSQPVSYRVEYHADPQRNKLNGVLDVSVDDSVDGIPTEVWCVAQNPWFKPGSNPTDFNADKMRGHYLNVGNAPHYMRLTFGDADQIGQRLVTLRAQWAAQRAIFDAFSMTVELFGHSQGGLMFAPDTMVAVNDSVHNIIGNFYCSACRYTRDRAGGTRTALTLRKPNLLAA